MLTIFLVLMLNTGVDFHYRATMPGASCEASRQVPGVATVLCWYGGDSAVLLADVGTRTD